MLTRADTPNVGNILLFQRLVQGLALALEGIAIAAGQPKQLQLIAIGSRKHVADEGRREAANPGEAVCVLANAQSLPTTQRNPGNGSVPAVTLRRIVRLDVGNHCLKHILLESAAASLCVGHHDDHCNDFLLGIELIQDGIGRALFLPTGLVVARTVQQVEDWIRRVLWIVGRQIDHHPLFAAKSLFEVVLHSLKLAPLDAAAHSDERHDREEDQEESSSQ